MSRTVYPGIPEPTTALESLQATVMALKQAVEILTGQKGVPPSVVTQQDLTDLGLVYQQGQKADKSLELEAGAGLTGGGDLSGNRSFAVGAGTGILANADDVAVDKASAANAYAAAPNKVLTTDLIESGSAAVVLTHGAPTALDWDAGIYRTWTMTASVTLSNPTNGQPGTWRTIRVVGDSATDRAITFDTQYVLSPTIADVDSGQPYLLMIFCHTASVFYVFAQALF